MDSSIIRCFVGFDPREAIAFHVFCQSVLETSSQPVAFIPLHKPLLSGFDGQRDGSNAFIFSRYLVPRLCNYTGWALFFDGDMVVKRDVAELWNLQSENIGKAVCVVKHDYKTKSARKYIGSRLENDNKDYPRKNWSSVMLWDCAHYGNRGLDESYLSGANTQEIHRFGWLKDESIGELPHDWNHLVGEDPPGPAHLFHYTLGIPGLKHYADDTASWNWHRTLLGSLECAGERASDIVKRAEECIGAIR
jgi:lipopolysaccharide biosynthesis glycosyltransferase